MAKSKERERDRESEKKSKKRSRDETRLDFDEQHSGDKNSSSRSRKHGKRKSRDHGGSGSSSEHHHKKGSGKGGGKEREKEQKKSSSSSSKKSKEQDSTGSRLNKRSKDKKDHGQDIEVAIRISENDYFTRATEFKVWLFQRKKHYFEDLTSAESHELFGKFVKDWNRGKLDPHFYEGHLPEELVARARKTQHKWGFIKNLTDRDQMQLASANDSVHSSTEKVKGVTSNVPTAPVGSVAASSGGINALMPPPRGRGTGKRPGNERRGEDDDGDGRDASGRRTEKKRQRKQEKEKHAVILDEIAPKETGRQEITDKRRAVGARTHAAAKEREDAADGLDMREADTMGGGDSFQEMLARSKGAKQRRQSAKELKLQELAAKEEEKRAAFLEQMGLKAGQKITIKPRNDG